MAPFLPLFKADQASRTVWARAAAEEPDKAKEIMDYVSAKPQFEAWSKRYSDATLGKSLGNVRAMHNPRHLAGKVQEIVYDDAGKAIEVCIKVLDPVDWIKVEEGGYTGISMGGGYHAKWPDKLLKDHIRYTPRLGEISLVDSPCIPSATFLDLQKADGSMEKIALVGQPRSFAQLVPPPTFGDLHKGLLGSAASTATKFASAYAKAGKSFIARSPVGRKVASVVAHPKVATALREANHSGWKGAITPAHTLGRAAGSMVGPKTAKWAGHVGMVGDSAPTAYGVANAAGVFSHGEDKKPLKKAGDPAAKAKIALTMHEWKAGKLRSWRGKTARGNPRKGPKVTDQKQAIAIALSQARRAGMQKGWAQTAGRGVARALDANAALGRHGLRVGEKVGAKVGKVVGGTVGLMGVPGAVGAGLGAGILALDARRAKRLEMPAHMQKSEIATAIDERMEKWVIPAAAAVGGALATGHVAGHVARAALRRLGAKHMKLTENAFRANLADPVANAELARHTGKLVRAGIGAAGGTVAAQVAGGVAGWKLGRHVENKTDDENRRAVRNSYRKLQMPAHMKKGDAEVFLDRLEMNKGMKAKPSLANLSDEHNDEGRIDTTTKPTRGNTSNRGNLSSVGPDNEEQEGKPFNQNFDRVSLRSPANHPSSLSDKQHAQRIEAAKARWLKEGHHDLDQHFNDKHAHAGKAILGRANKVAAIEQERHNTWSSIADTHDAYDKVRAHMHPHENLMMEVPHQGGLLYNPEGVGSDHFNAHGAPHNPLVLLHPAEADDWITKHGKDAKAVTKMAPRGAISNLRDLGWTGSVSGIFKQLRAA